MPVSNKYFFYELAVQSPHIQVEHFQKVYRDLHEGRFARHFREDFCGTFRLSHAWVSRNLRNTALGLDLDPEPIAYGKRNHYRKLSREQKNRLEILRQDVRTVTRYKADFIAACNFSFCIFKKREDLVTYFRAAHRSLRPGGLLFTEVAGGPGMINPIRERKTVRLSDQVKGPKFAYVWHQRSFDPINNNGKYAIHFELPTGQKLKNAFTYDWRLWNIPEIRDAMMDAGFDQTQVYWESTHKGEGTGEFVRTEKGGNDYSWIAYVVGMKKPQAK